jgi:hypothetical protein
MSSGRAGIAEGAAREKRGMSELMGRGVRSALAELAPAARIGPAALLKTSRKQIGAGPSTCSWHSRLATRPDRSEPCFRTPTQKSAAPPWKAALFIVLDPDRRPCEICAARRKLGNEREGSPALLWRGRHSPAGRDGHRFERTPDRPRLPAAVARRVSFRFKPSCPGPPSASGSNGSTDCTRVTSMRSAREPAVVASKAR